MPQRGGLVGLHEHPSPTVWKSQIQKSSKKHSFRGHMEGCHARAARKKQTQKFLGLTTQRLQDSPLMA